MRMCNAVLLLMMVPLMLMSLMVMPSFAALEREYSILNMMPSLKSSTSRSYAVVFDAGSSGSRVHVFCFDHNLDLVPVGDGTDLEFFIQVKPGLSAYANDPQAAAASLLPLLAKAESVVPKELRQQTPVRVGATAGLRLLEGKTAEKILQAVRDLLSNRSTLKSEPDGVAILDGDQEGSYQWITINYLLQNLGMKYGNTVGVVDLGGGSVQMAYAISKERAASAPGAPEGKNPYVTERLLKGTKYYLYAHSYLSYGLLAARAEILKVSKNSSNPCILVGYNGFYTYGGVAYKASAPISGSSFRRCRMVVLKSLKLDEICKYNNCTFNGVWNGGGGDGQKNLYVASFFFDKAAEAGFIDSSAPVAKATPADFKRAAARACKTKYKDINSAFPNWDTLDLPYVCLDLSFQYTLLVNGFGVSPRQEITLVKRVKYHDSLLEAAWPLGNAIEVVSSLA